MRRLGVFVASLAAMGASASAHAATILNLNPTKGTLSFVDLTTTPNRDVTPGGDYASLEDAYVFGEGADVIARNSFTNYIGIAGRFAESYLLSYDRDPGRGVVSGSFDLQLNAGQKLLGVFSNLAGMVRTDFDNGVIYSTNPKETRGLEAAHDSLDVADLGGGLYRVSYYLDNTAGTSDQTRFMVAGVPEPAQWAMMLSGFGLVGYAMRRRRRTVTHALA